MCVWSNGRCQTVKSTVVAGINVYMYPNFCCTETGQDPLQEASVTVSTEPAVETRLQYTDSDDAAGCSERPRRR